MTRCRPFISALLGLLLLVQGFAVAAADRALPADTAGTEQAVPCHGQAPEPASSCCDADCPDMTACLLGQLAPATAGAALDAAAAEQTAFAEPAISPSSASPQTPLRPPIPFQS